MRKQTIGGILALIVVAGVLGHFAELPQQQTPDYSQTTIPQTVTYTTYFGPNVNGLGHRLAFDFFNSTNGLPIINDIVCLYQTAPEGGNALETCTSTGVTNAWTSNYFYPAGMQFILNVYVPKPWPAFSDGLFSRVVNGSEYVQDLYLP